MGTRIIENGLSDDSNADAFITSDLIITGAVIWVDSVNGSAGGAGTFEDPVDDIAQAIANATADNGDIVILKENHSETLTGSVSFSKAGMKFFGLGSGATRPSFTCNAAIDLFSLDAVGIEINGFYFPAGTTTPNTSRINVAAAGCKIKDCTFLCGANDPDTITIPDAGDYCNIDSCTFTVSADGPNKGISIEAAAVAGLIIQNCSFDGDDYGWDDAAIYSAVAHLNWIYANNTLTNGSDILHTAAAKGYLYGTVAGDECQVTV